MTPLLWKNATGRTDAMEGAQDCDARKKKKCDLIEDKPGGGSRGEKRGTKNSIPALPSPLSPSVMSWCCFWATLSSTSPLGKRCKMEGVFFSHSFVLTATTMCSTFYQKLSRPQQVRMLAKQDAGTVPPLFYRHGLEVHILCLCSLFISQHVKFLKLILTHRPRSYFHTHNTSNIRSLKAGQSIHLIYIKMHIYYSCPHKPRHHLFFFIFLFAPFTRKMTNCVTWKHKHNPSLRYVWILGERCNIHFNPHYVFPAAVSKLFSREAGALSDKNLANIPLDIQIVGDTYAARKPNVHCLHRVTLPKLPL